MCALLPWHVLSPGCVHTGIHMQPLSSQARMACSASSRAPTKAKTDPSSAGDTQGQSLSGEPPPGPPPGGGGMRRRTVTFLHRCDALHTNEPQTNILPRASIEQAQSYEIQL
jgi:hypothetical protein